MDVDSFIEKYRGEWAHLERVCAEGAQGLTSLPGPEIREAIRLYLRASGHLAEVQARYEDPALQAYLNELVSRAHGAIYSARPRTARGFVRLFAVRYPAAMRRTTPYVLVAAAILVSVTLASWAWVATSRMAQAGVLPAGAREAIRQAGGLRVNLGPPAGLSTLILFNNVQVAFLAFALGITCCVGTIIVLIRNALLLGALAGAFQAVGNAGSFWALVLPHGLLELTAICIAAGAGLRMGWTLVDPGDRPRGKALREEAPEAVVVVLGVIPAFVVAAIIEGFVTGSAIPDVVEIGLGLAVASTYVAYLAGWRPRSPRGVATGDPRS